MVQRYRVPSMKPCPFVLVILPDEVGMMGEDIACRPAREHLHACLSQLDTDHVKLAVGDSTSSPEWFAAYPNFGQCRLDELHALYRDDKEILIVDGRAWFSKVGLEGLALRGRQSG